MKTMLTFLVMITVVLSSEAQSLIPTPLKPVAAKFKKQTIGSNTSFVPYVENQDKELKGPDSTYWSAGDKRFYLFGSTSINSTDQLISSLQASQKFLCTFVIMPQIKNFGLDMSVGANALNLKPNNVDKDSIDINSFLFPETGNYGLMLTPAIHYYRKSTINNTYRFGGEASFGLRQNSITINNKDTANNIISSENVSFSALNWNIMPVKFTYFYHPENDPDFQFIFSIGAYYHIFNIPNEDAASFNKLFPESESLFKDKKGSMIHAGGCKLTVSINNFMFFADLRHNFENDNTRSNTPLTGFVFNAGFATNFIVFSK